MTDKLDAILIASCDTGFEKKLDRLYKKQLEASLFKIESAEYKTVLNIIRDVANEGDKKLAELTNKYDRVNFKPADFLIPLEQLEKAHKRIDKDLLESLRKAIANVRKYQQKIFIGDSKYDGLKYTPLKRIGICVPGASAPLPSTVIMCAVPAQVAGVKDIVIVSPPRHKGTIHPDILAVCHELGISEVYRIGGAQAIAALAAGTETIDKVDKIVGPGNKWVTTAKKLVANRYVSIDSIAGPSEVLIIANEKANPKWIAADMLSQAEHGTDSTAIIATWPKEMGQKILAELKQQLAELERSEQARESLIKCGAIVTVKNENKAIDLANKLASEHLQIQCGDKSKDIAEKIDNAGAIFIGDYCPVAVGDYWAGPSHTLPTARSARFSSALTSNDFIKSISIIEYDKEKLTESAGDIIRLAQAEGLDAHARSVNLRLNS